jgi:hypothetical protein
MSTNRKQSPWVLPTEQLRDHAGKQVNERPLTQTKDYPCGCRGVVVAEGPDYKVELVHILPGTDPGICPRSLADILCLDLHAFGMSKAMTWVREAQNAASLRDGGVSLCISVLGSLDQLNAEQLSDISQELSAFGAVFSPWPENCQTFDEAFTTLAHEIEKTYGPMFMYKGDSIVEWTAESKVLVHT